MKKLTFIFLLIGLTGCSSYSNHFDCPYGEGVGCSSLSKVNRMLDQNLIDTSEEIPSRVPKNKRQIHVYYGSKQMDRVITVKEPGNF